MHPLRLEVCLQHNKVKTSCEYHRWAYIYCERIFRIFNFMRKLLKTSLSLLQSPYKYIALSHLQTPIVSCLHGYLSAEHTWKTPHTAHCAKKARFPAAGTDIWILLPNTGVSAPLLDQPKSLIFSRSLIQCFFTERILPQKRMAFLQCTAERHSHHKFKSRFKS